MSVRSLLTQRCTVSRWQNRVPDELGVIGPPVFTVVKSDVLCLVQHHSARVLRSAHGIDVTYTATGFFLPGEDVRPKPGQTDHADRITVVSGGSGTYKTQGVLDEAGKGALLTVALEAV